MGAGVGVGTGAGVGSGVGSWVGVGVGVGVGVASGIGVGTAVEVDAASWVGVGSLAGRDAANSDGTGGSVPWWDTVAETTATTFLGSASNAAGSVAGSICWQANARTAAKISIPASIGRGSHVLRFAIALSTSLAWLSLAVYHLELEPIPTTWLAGQWRADGTSIQAREPLMRKTGRPDDRGKRLIISADYLARFVPDVVDQLDSRRSWHITGKTSNWLPASVGCEPVRYAGTDLPRPRAAARAAKGHSQASRQPAPDEA